MPQITELEYQRAIAKIQFHQQQVHKYKAITRKYNYDLEAERVKIRKADSEKWHRENKEL